MGICQAVENRSGKILFLKKKYPLFHESLLKDNNTKYISNYETELWEHYLTFTEYKEELFRTNPTLHQQLFDLKVNTESLEVERIMSDNEEKFFFFFNKRRFKELTIKNSQIVFPRLSFQYFPRYKDDKTSLTTLIINDSSLRMEEQPNYYPYLENIEVIEISFCNLESLPEAFGLIKNVKRLTLRRNSLRALPKSFDTMREIEYLDLSENCFATLPKEIFSHGYKLVTLNMCGNELERFEFIGAIENYSLEFLFLARNKLTKIPLEIRKFQKIKYVNLDENLINERLNNLNEEIPLNAKLSCLKNKGLNEIIELEKPDIANKRQEDFNQSRKSTIVKDPGTKDNKSQDVSFGFNPAKTGTDLNQNKDNVLEAMRIKQTHTELEADIAKFLDKVIDQILSNDDRKDLESEKVMIRQEQYIFMVEKLETLINIGREKEIGQIEDFTLRDLFKKCYGTYLKVQELNNNGVLPCTLDEMNQYERNYFLMKVLKHDTKEHTDQDLKNKLQELKQDNKVKKREDVSNLLFLKHMNQTLSSSKVKLFLQYLGNIDGQIKEHVISLWNTADNNSFILLLTELKLFLREMLDYYESKYSEGLYNIRYETIVSEAKTVIHEIFYNDTVVKILYRLGLADKVEVFKGIVQDQFIFTINSNMNKKHANFENYLMRFIIIIKTEKVDKFEID